jgi:hypothetical protein
MDCAQISVCFSLNTSMLYVKGECILCVYQSKSQLGWSKLMFACVGQHAATCELVLCIVKSETLVSNSTTIWNEQEKSLTYRSGASLLPQHHLLAHFRIPFFLMVVLCLTLAPQIFDVAVRLPFAPAGSSGLRVRPCVVQSCCLAHVCVCVCDDEICTVFARDARTTHDSHHHHTHTHAKRARAATCVFCPYHTD